jgi:hypothetical protein
MNEKKVFVRRKKNFRVTLNIFEEIAKYHHSGALHREVKIARAQIVTNIDQLNFFKK